MKKIIPLLLFVFVAIFFCMPVCCYADVPTALSYKFTTHISNWNTEDVLVFHCSTSDSFDSVVITYGENTEQYTSCDVISIQDISSFVDGDSVTIEETFIITDVLQDSVTINPGTITIDDDYQGTSFEEAMMQAYHPEEYTSSIDLSRWENDILGDDPVLADEVDLGTINFFDLFVSYHFVVRGDLADPSGHFLFAIEDVDEPVSFSSGDTLVFAGSDPNDYELPLNLSILKEYFEEKPEINYTGVFNDQDYSVAVLNLNGNDYDSIQEDENGRWGLFFEVEARNDSTIANTGLWYDIGPYVLLAIVFFGFLFMFKKHKIKEDEKELH